MRFLECVEKKFLMQVIMELMIGDDLLDLVFTNKEELLADAKGRNCLSCSAHEMVVFLMFLLWVSS